MKLFENFSIEDELSKIKKTLSVDSKINEIQLFDTNTKIFVFYINSVYYISLRNVLDIFEYFMKCRLKDEICTSICSVLDIKKMSEVDTEAQNKDLEVCKIDDIKDNIKDFIIQNNLYQSCEESADDIAFQNIDLQYMIQSKNEHKISTSMLEESYPYATNWNDNMMDAIIQNIYNGDGFETYELKNDVMMDQVKKTMGRGRCRVKQTNLKDRPFVCEYPDCKRAFKRFEHLKRHNKMHTGERPYKCKYPGCNKSFSRSDNLSQHYKIHNVSAKPSNINFRLYHFNNKGFP